MKIGILGITGKFGKAILKWGSCDPEIESICDGTSPCDVVIDASHFSALQLHLEMACSRKIPILIATTGHPSEHKELLLKASKIIPLLYAPNLSLNVALLKKFLMKIAIAAQNIEIYEEHDVQKKDKPSGTALDFAAHLKEICSCPISITSSRKENALPKHTISVHLEDEILTFSHEALNRNAYAKGAIKVAKFLVNKPPGFYTLEAMQDDDLHKIKRKRSATN